MGPYRILLIFILSILFFSCDFGEKNEVATTWISGQVINPKFDYVIFGKGDQNADTVKLDSNNFFIYKSEKIQTGLYSFRHGESQVFFIEPGDSLLIHVNTIEFDESLSYSGKGGEQNNFLINLFLKNEKENEALQEWYKLSPENFSNKVDSLRNDKFSQLENFIDRNDGINPEFEKIAKAGIRYNNYLRKELYISANLRNVKQFPQSFFNYRKDIDFQQNGLRFYYPYYRFLNRYFENLVMEKYGNITEIDRTSYDYNFRKLNMIDSLVFSDTLKNSLLRGTMVRYLIRGRSAIEEQKMVALYKKLSTDKEDVAEIDELASATIKLAPGNSIPDIPLVNTENVVATISEIIEKPTVLYFWSASSVKHFRDIHTRSAELKSKFPEYDFIGINTDSHFKRWRETIQKTGYDVSEEFQLENLTDSRNKLVLNSINKVIIVDKNGIILEGNTNMFNSNFEELLLGYLNR
ncbi:TlpA family protein disulfide reductase [Aequorivita echinoideorum]|uniref:Thioredoxin domain-containing protein n=1 Tax=Aequorivita echinoideorum TaxID=1549647 RepID=A0ABS5S8F8_9FLAO|nr:thioredoxin-like domain-containing protein [Aequorivita echinoideorum]MBT0608637.1 hypothetical protein [Aequorivita echinoideorum]